MIGIINTEAQNIGSIKNCLDYLSIKYKLIDSPSRIKNFTHLILPGVGNYDKVLSNLKKKDFSKKDLIEIFRHKKILAICVGFQILFRSSDEGKLKGIGVYKQKVENLKKIKKNLIVPHVGYNSIFINILNSQLKKIFNSDFYFTHSYAVRYSKEIINDKSIVGCTTYGKIKFISFIEDKNIIATQFHPEKSGKPGLDLISYFYAKKKNNF